LRRCGTLKQPQEIQDHNCLLFSLPGFRSRWIFRDQEGIMEKVPVSGRTIISNAIAFQQATLAGMGLALLPNWLIDSDVEAGTLVNVFPHYEVQQLTFTPQLGYFIPLVPIFP
jgi:DNA-binding transcriptional LysR family regulator